MSISLTGDKKHKKEKQFKKARVKKRAGTSFLYRCKVM